MRRRLNRRASMTNRPLPGGAGGDRPIVAIVGRPNVGKSTLFNALIGRKLAIVDDTPGVTRDRHYGDAHAMGRDFILVDTGGLDVGSDDPRMTGIAGQVKVAVQECDLVICLLDATTDATPADIDAVHLLRRSRKPVLFVVNKAETKTRAQEANSYYELGIKELIFISAIHREGIVDLQERIAGLLPTSAAEPRPIAGDDVPRIAIVGRPNAGKSSLVNRLLGEERQLVEPTAGTTVDSIDSLFSHNGRDWVLIDTAGIRRSRSVEEGIESLGVVQAIRAIDRSDLVLLLIDAERGVAEQDARIAGLAVERGRALVIGLNKMDLLTSKEAIRKAMRKIKDDLRFVLWADVVQMSTKTGRGLSKLWPAVLRAVTEHRKRVTTADVNRFFTEVLDRHPPPTFRNRQVRLFYITQVHERPPAFVVVTNQPDGVHESYQRYVVNQLREQFGFAGTPVEVRYRAKRKAELD